MKMRKIVKKKGRKNENGEDKKEERAKERK
jgi:hypothetical protein